MILGLLTFLLHVIYFCAGVAAIFFASLSIGRFIEIRVNRFKARQELAQARECDARKYAEIVERARDWQFPPKGYPKAEYVAPLGKTRVGVRRKS